MKRNEVGKKAKTGKESDRPQTAADLESQNDLAYIMGPHSDEDRKKQIKSPGRAEESGDQDKDQEKKG
jgi:hypothetical protein